MTSHNKLHQNEYFVPVCTSEITTTARQSKKNYRWSTITYYLSVVSVYINIMITTEWPVSWLTYAMIWEIISKQLSITTMCVTYPCSWGASLWCQSHVCWLPCTCTPPCPRHRYTECPEPQSQSHRWSWICDLQSKQWIVMIHIMVLEETYGFSKKHTVANRNIRVLKETYGC